MAFAHLHVHTEYSLLDGSNKIKEYVSQVKALGMDSAAITDHGVMYGVIDFYRACKSEGIRPVLGCEVYVAPGSRFDREKNAGDDRYYHLILLAENNTGYSNLYRRLLLQAPGGSGPAAGIPRGHHLHVRLPGGGSGQEYRPRQYG